MAGGPTTRDTSTLALGLAQVRVVASAANIGAANIVSSSSDSIGSLTATKFVGEVEYWRHYSGFPLKEDYVIPLREKAQLECNFEEIKPYTLALAKGIDPTSGSYDSAHTGEILLGAATAPAYIRVEAEYTFPNGTNKMYVIFPRAQATSAFEIDLQAEDSAKPPVVLESKLADSTQSGGNAIWDTCPLGKILFV